ncbi:HEAT repeat domain-containing protein [Longimicrobium sp.]|uniref:HEAT repeat domain-containing protein n=1 Tax=Longimicrobium sp. TaxID=2029185 RepID=UPI002CFA0EF7|nr:HEAT repeat domain-containing protein [Longimicrobium sp.]HSU18052.1 HEAT repeat domain-containing protein [Longimicrobium sp.]
MAQPGSEFLRALASAALREEDPAALAGRAAAALGGVFQRQKNLVLDVQFTGFLFKGKALGGVDPSLLRAAGQLIVLHVKRVGFTPDAGEADLRTFFEILARSPADLAEDSVVVRLQRRRPAGIYVSTITGETYRPPARPKPEPAAETPAQATEPQTASGDADAGAAASPTVVQTMGTGDATPSISSADAGRGGGEAAAPDAAESFDAFDVGETELSDFELLDEFPDLGAPAAPAKPSSPAPAPGGRGEEVSSNDMFHFFRTVQSDRTDAEAEELAGMLHAAENPSRFDELAEACARTAQRLVRGDGHAQAVELLEALAREAERADRTRLFRDSALGVLRRLGAGETLQQLGDLLQRAAAAERDRILHILSVIGGDATPLLETILFRTGEAELRVAIFRHLARHEGAAQRLIARAMSDPAPARTRLMLELAALPGLDGDVALRWIGEAAGHADAGVRTDAAKYAAVIGGRGGLRVLLDLLNNDRDAMVKRAAIHALGALGDAAAVPFLIRVVGDSGDEDVQVAAIHSLGRLGSGEALPVLAGIINKRGLFAGKKLSRVKHAALAAIARIPTPAAREVIHSIAGGKDGELSAEAQRVLATMD